VHLCTDDDINTARPQYTPATSHIAHMPHVVQDPQGHMSISRRLACIAWVLYCVCYWSLLPTSTMRDDRARSFCPCHRCLGLQQWQQRTIKRHLDRQRLLELDLMGMQVPTHELGARPGEHGQHEDDDVPYMDIDYENDYVGDNPIQDMPGWNDTVTVRVPCAWCIPVVACMHTPTPAMTPRGPYLTITG
jgi:hypothetical protein